MNNGLINALIKAGVYTVEQRQKAEEEARKRNCPVWMILHECVEINEELLSQTLSEYLRLPLVKLAAAEYEAAALKKLPEAMARKNICIPLSIIEPNGRRPALRLAMYAPVDLAAQNELEFITGCSLELCVATRTEIIDAIGREYGSESWLSDFLTQIDDSQMHLLSIDDEEDVTRIGGEKTPPVIKLLNLIIQRGLREQASDIHIEPLANHLQVRVRVSGMLKQIMVVPKWLHEPVISRLKVLARMDITERRRPQDGRIKVAYGQNEIDLRVSTLPTHFGEKAVMRILGSGQRVPKPEELGMHDEDLETIRRAASQPQGMILVTGPTGSGKTTTLYSLIDEKKNPEINIVTVEDPIEIQLPGINQVQVNVKAGLTFAASLRSILRQDPDVILIGEIRDLETAEIAVNSAQTGHLVLSTLHTNSTSATLSRLYDLGVDPFLISASINLIIAQRLLRRVCPHCREPYEPDEKTLERLHLERAVMTYVHGAGCEHCGGSGYEGRIGVYEIMRCTSALREMISHKLSEGEIRRAALESGMTTLLDSAIGRVAEGLTTVEEIVRVLQIDEEENARCPRCRAVVSPQFVACPYCAYVLRCNCAKCHQELQPEWKACPYCGAPKPDQEETPLVMRPRSGRSLPLGAATTPAIELPASTPNTSSGRSGEKPTILVVDDDAVIRGVICSALSLLPCEPILEQAEDGLDALDKALRIHPDIIVTDVNMPQLDGIELCKKLRAEVETAFIPILMLTVSDGEKMRIQGYLVGADDYMAKPFSIKELNARVSRLLSRSYGF